MGKEVAKSESQSAKKSLIFCANFFSDNKFYNFGNFEKGAKGGAPMNLRSHTLFKIDKKNIMCEI